MMAPVSVEPSRRGVALVIGMVILIVMTLMLLSAVTLSTGNLKAVSNAQFRDSALAAANLAVEQVVSTAFMNAPEAVRVAVDIDRDGLCDYTVDVPAPACTRWAIPAPGDLDPSKPADQPCFSSSRIGGLSAGPGGSVCADTLWELRAQVVDAGTGQAADAMTGAAVTINQGIQVRMSKTLAQNACD
jgi:hypothetical protein